MADAQGRFVAAEPLFDDLPMGWTRTALGQVAEINPSGKTVGPPDDTLVSFLPMAAVEELSGRIDTHIERPFAEVKKGFTRFRDGDLLFAKITPSMENGKIAVARNLKNGMGCGTTEFHVLRPSEGIEVDYLRYFVLRDCFRGEAQRQMSGAVGQQRVPSQFLALYPLPLPPLAEQRRIVSRIDELFSRIEAGERAIAAARTGLKRYRKSILKAAVTGALTADWREERGQSGPPVEHPTGELPELPYRWAWATIDQLTTHITSGSRDWKPFYDRGTSVFILAQNVRPGRLDLSTVQNVDPPQGDRDAKRSEVRLDDLLVTIVGANTGDVCRVPKELDRHYVCQSVALLRFADPSLARYAELFLQDAGPGRDQIKRFIYGAGRPHLSFEQLRSIAVAIPPEDERTEIVSRAEAALSRIRHADGTLDAQTRNARALKQSILKAAFEGRLIPQDSDDEPASDMLARIAGEPPALKTKTKARA